MFISSRFLLLMAMHVTTCFQIDEELTNVDLWHMMSPKLRINKQQAR